MSSTHPYIASGVGELVNSTPMLALNRLAKKLGLGAHLFAKLEFANPAGSVKDRVARAMLDAAEKEGRLKPGGTIIEPTSGNTGIALAALGVPRGYRVIIVMPASMSLERRQLVRAYGGELKLSPAEKGMAGALETAAQLVEEMPDAIIMGQFDNPANPHAHRAFTGPEIYWDTGGEVDAFVAGIGTGGTISGVGNYLKEQNPAIKIIGVEPAESPVLSGGRPGAHKIQGIGAGFVPANLDRKVLDAVRQISGDLAIATARILASTEGILAGISSGAALAAAIEEATLEENSGKNIVVLLPDRGERYLSSGLYPDS